MRIWQSWIIPALGISGSVLFGGCADQTAAKAGSKIAGGQDGESAGTTARLDRIASHNRPGLEGEQKNAILVKRQENNGSAGSRGNRHVEGSSPTGNVASIDKNAGNKPPINIPAERKSTDAKPNGVETKREPSVAIGTKEGKLVQAPKAHRDGVPQKAASGSRGGGEVHIPEAQREEDGAPPNRVLVTKDAPPLGSGTRGAQEDDVQQSPRKGAPPETVGSNLVEQREKVVIQAVAPAVTAGLGAANVPLVQQDGGDVPSPERTAVMASLLRVREEVRLISVRSDRLGIATGVMGRPDQWYNNYADMADQLVADAERVRGEADQLQAQAVAEAMVPEADECGRLRVEAERIRVRALADGNQLRQQAEEVQERDNGRRPLVARELQKEPLPIQVEAKRDLQLEEAGNGEMVAGLGNPSEQQVESDIESTQDEDQQSDAEAETEPTPLARLEAVREQGLAAEFHRTALDQQASVAQLRELVNGIQRMGVARLGLDGSRKLAGSVVGLLNSLATARGNAERGRDSAQQFGLEENSFITIVNDIDQLRETAERLGQGIAQRIRELEVEAGGIRTELREEALRMQGLVADARGGIAIMDRVRNDGMSREKLTTFAEMARQMLDRVTTLGADADRYGVLAELIGVELAMNPFTALVGEFAQLRRDIEQINQEFSDRLRPMDGRDLAAVAV